MVNQAGMTKCDETMNSLITLIDKALAAVDSDAEVETLVMVSGGDYLTGNPFRHYHRSRLDALTGQSQVRAKQ